MSFDTLVNFRDLGDYKTKDGRQIVAKKLLRSGELASLSQHDIDLLINEYQLTKIIDFRSDKEVLERPDSKIEGAKYNHIDMFKGDEEDTPALKQMEEANPNRTADERMMYAYEHLIISPVSQKGFKDFFNILLHNETGSSIWHCFAGKDRTGLGSALVLYVLGASKETIFDDFMRTNASRKEANELIKAEALKEGVPAERLADLDIMLNVKLEYLTYAIDVINKNFESLDNYVDNVLKITAAEKAAFRDLYLK